MKKALITLLLVCCGVHAFAQDEEPKKNRIYSHELGIRYGAQIYIGDGQGPELQAFSIDYAWYSYYNIGFRTGLNVFIDDDMTDYYAVPMQFTWRSGRIASAWRRESRSNNVRNNYYNGYYSNDYYTGGGSYDRSSNIGSALLTTLLAILPSAFEAHAGFTPGLIGGPTHIDTSGYNGWTPYLAQHRFACTFDLGARMIIPIWRFNLFLDCTYHCYLTDNFRRGTFRPTRSYMGIGGGLSLNF